MKTLAIGLALSCALSGAAFAQQTGMIVSATPGATYFNRPGTTLESHRAALEDCRRDVAGLMQPYPNSAGAQPLQAQVVSPERWSARRWMRKPRPSRR